MKKILILILFFFNLACKQNAKRVDVESQLKKTMSEFLYKTVNNDSSKVTFEIEELIYFKDPEFYECEFKVKMKQANHDTTDIMKARIAKDFSKVVRMS